MTGLGPSLAAVGGILLGAGTVGFAVAGAVVPRARVYLPERLAWSLALAALLLAGSVPACFALAIAPGWLPLVVAAALLFAVSRLFLLPARAGEAASPHPASPPVRGRGEGAGEGGRGGRSLATVILLLLLLAGILLYLLRALTEPMWSNDFLAIWGWRGKTIFGLQAVPEWMWRLPELSFTHPEYPLGLPFLYASVSFLLGRWDDHAMAFLYPATQIATLLALWGWLRRRGAVSPIPLAAASALALFEPLYRAFTTGMAEVPLSFFLFLLGTALADAADGEPGAPRRVALAALGAAGLKNEGLFAAGIAALLALAAPLPLRPRLRIAAAALLPALCVFAAHRALTGPLPLRDFRFALAFSPDFPSRLLLGLRTILNDTVLPAAPGVIALALLLAAGRRVPAGDRLLLLAALPLAVYAILPAFCVLGPDWLARTAFARTAAALVPLAVAGVALRLAPLVNNRQSTVDSPQSTVHSR